MKKLTYILILATLATGCDAAFTDFHFRLSDRTGCAEGITSIEDSVVGEELIYGAMNQMCEQYGAGLSEADIRVRFPDEGKVVWGNRRKAWVDVKTHFSKDGETEVYYVNITKQSPTVYSHLYHEFLHVAMAENEIPFDKHHDEMVDLGLCDNLQKDGFWTHCKDTH